MYVNRADKAMGGRKKLHQTWLVVDSGKVARVQGPPALYSDWIVNVIRELLFIFSVVIMYGGCFSERVMNFQSCILKHYWLQ